MTNDADGSPPATSRSGRMTAWISQARGGSVDAVGCLSEECRQYLLAIAHAELHSRLRPKLGGSDLVQQTLLEAFQDFSRFSGNDEVELLAWLRQILINNLANVERQYFGTAKRDLAREVALEVTQERNEAARVADRAERSPEGAAMLEEETQRLLMAIDELPPVMAQVIRLHHEQGLTFAEIGARIQRSPEAARKLWVRAVRALQGRIRPPDEVTPPS
ncbi:MAG: sigma-70 family RNA polymerase sigma factor [Pirellulales bacterium]